MDSLQNFNNLNACCRTCLNNTSDMMYISIFAVRDDSVTVAEMLSSCTSIKVRSNDRLPKKLCGSCYNCLISFYDFKKLAENVNTKLWNHFQECQITVPDNPSDDILREMKAEIIDLGINTYHYDGRSETYAENGSVNGTLEPYQGDDRTYSHHSTNNGDDKTDYCHNEVQSQVADCKPIPAVKPYTCEICSENFKRRYEFIRHLVTHGEGSKLNSNMMKNNNECFKCDVCPAMFQSINSLSAHKKKHVNKDRILSCTICKKIFKKLSHLKRHEMCHEVNRPHKCSICAKSFTSDAVLNEHINLHKGIKPHDCPLCSKSFAHLSTLNNHIKIHIQSRKNYLCPTCGKKFDSSSNLKQHVLRHAGLKMFTCNLCPRRFVSKGELKCHETTHSGLRSYTCDECGSAFTKQSALGKHKFRHTGIKPYHCDACSTNFISRADLKRHCRMHTGEKPYHCVKCERAFSQNSDLIRHQRIHCKGNQYRCGQCAKSFRLKSDLLRHISEHYVASQIPDTEATVEDLPKLISEIEIELKPDNIVDDNDGDIKSCV